MEQTTMKQKVLDILFKNYNMNLFSSLHREQLAEQIVSNITGTHFTTDGVTENGVVAKAPEQGKPINAPKVDKSKKSKTASPVKTVRKKEVSQTKKVDTSKKRAPKKVRERNGTPQKSAGGGLKSLKNK